MDQIVTAFLFFVGFLFSLVTGMFAVDSHREGELRASRIAFGLVLVGLSVFIGAAMAPDPLPQIAFWVTIAMGVILGIVFFLPVGKGKPGEQIPTTRFDERQIMFARKRLQPGTPDYQAYYQAHPDHETADNQTRLLPGLLSPQAKLANPFLFAPVSGSFFLTGALYEAVDGPVAEARQSLPADQMTLYLVNLARFLGASQVGVTALQPYHVYSHVGRGSGVYGAPIPIDHRVAIAFTVEMDHQMVKTAPYPPTSIETGKQYVEAARVAVQLAAAIRALGYPARAHIDGNYRVIAPLVARDAGLGEIGRMTILLTPQQGPRVRLAVVTADLDLITDGYQPDQSVLDFCNICQKCADACPSKSIPHGPPQEIDGVLRWKLNPDTCFRYWNTIGTDCARCMAVCPFSHPDTFSHNLVRWGIARSGSFRRAALWLDDLFYGRKPASAPAPGWTKIP